VGWMPEKILMSVPFGRLARPTNRLGHSVARVHVVDQAADRRQKSLRR
jgi:hypothetical protein